MPPLNYLDTSVFIRHITQDDRQMAQQARTLFKQLEVGQATATTNRVPSSGGKWPP